MHKRDFLKQLADFGAQLRQNIANMAMDWTEEEREKRLSEVFNPEMGYRYFVQNYFPHYTQSPDTSQLHDYLFATLPELLSSPESEHCATGAPRGEGKSTLVTRLFTLYCLLTNQKRYIVLIMESLGQAYNMLEAIKAELETNPRIKMDFPDAFGIGTTWQAEQIICRNSVKVQIAGSGKRLRGLVFGAYRPDLIILDDLENDEQVRSPEQRDKLHSWLTKTVLPLGAVGDKCDVIYIGTILHYDSVLARTLSNKAWRTAKFKALPQFPINMKLWDEWEQIYLTEGKEAGRQFYQRFKSEMDLGAVVSWKSRGLLTLMEIRARDGHATFDSEYQNDPINSAEALFTDFVYYSDLPKDLVYFGAVDPSLGKAGHNRDPSAILVGGISPDGVLYVIEASIKKRLPDLIISDVIEYQKQYSCHLWLVESVQFQEFLRTELVKRSAQMGVPVPARAVIPHSDKGLRIESLQPHIKNGLIRFHTAQSALLSQLRHYPKADHDDGADALHMLWAGAVSNRFGKNTIQAIQLPEPRL